MLEHQLAPRCSGARPGSCRGGRSWRDPMRNWPRLATWPVAAGDNRRDAARGRRRQHPDPPRRLRRRASWSSTGASRPARGRPATSWPSGSPASSRSAGCPSATSTRSASPRSCRRSAAQYEQLTERYLEADCLTIGPGVKTGMPIRIDNPLEVGADRLVNAIAAYDRFGEACVVGRLRHRHQHRRGLRRRRVPRRRDRPRPRDLAHRPDRTGGPDHPDRPRRAAGSDRPLDPGGDPVRLHLRLRRPDRRHRPPDRRGTAEPAAARHRRLRLGDRPLHRDDRRGRRPAYPEGPAADP